MIQLDLLLIVLAVVFSVWIACVIWIIYDRKRYESRKRTYLAATEKLCNGEIQALPFPKRDQVVGSMLSALSDPVLDRLITTTSLPQWLHEALIVHIISTRDIDQLRHQAKSSKTERCERINSLTMLTRLRSRGIHRLLLKVLRDPDPELANAALLLLGRLQDQRAATILIIGLRRKWVSCSRIAMQLDRSPALKMEMLLPLLKDEMPHMRYWSVRLLARFPETEHRLLTNLADDPDPSVRKAVLQTLARLNFPQTKYIALDLLQDEVGFVRAQAVRALGSEYEHADTIAAILADPEWNVRQTARETLIKMGVPAAPQILAQLRSESFHAQEGATQILKELGILHIIRPSEKTPEASFDTMSNEKSADLRSHSIPAPMA